MAVRDTGLEFAGPAARLSPAGMAGACAILGIGEAELRAVLAVEALGGGFLPDGRPKILFERHWFHRLTQGRHSAAHPDISDTKPGGYQGGTAEYARLARAIALDRPAALDSASWGLGQIMGFNAKKAGYENAGAMAEAFALSEDAQVAAVARFIAASGAGRHLAAHDWAAFARAYNGPRFRDNAYDEKLAAAYARLAAQGRAPATMPDQA
ncbi:MAG: N-acetylmuramidase family protein [Rhodospirillales bacterium]